MVQLAMQPYRVYFTILVSTKRSGRHSLGNVSQDSQQLMFALYGVYAWL